MKTNTNQNVVTNELSNSKHCDESNVAERLSLLENEVNHLKTKRSEDEKMITQLMDRIERLEVSSNDTKECSIDKVGGRPKRPARLLPLQLLL